MKAKDFTKVQRFMAEYNTCNEMVALLVSNEPLTISCGNKELSLGPIFRAELRDKLIGDVQQKSADAAASLRDLGVEL